MESKPLRHFLAVAEHRNFTKAANELCIAQPALSISIKKLEQSLDVILFRREDRQISLTKEGEVLLPHAKKVVQQLDDAQLAMEELKGLIKGEVRLGAPSMMGSYFFPEILMAFKDQYPDLKLTLVDAGTQSIKEMLLNGELDIGVIMEKDAPVDLETDHLVTAEMVAVVGEGHELATKESLRFSEYFEHDLIQFKPGYFHREFIDSLCDELKIEPNIAFETNLVPMILNIIKHEFAITSLLKMVVENETGVVGIPFERPVTFNLSLAWRKEGYLSIADRAFISFIKEKSSQKMNQK